MSWQQIKFNAAFIKSPPYQGELFEDHRVRVRARPDDECYAHYVSYGAKKTEMFVWGFPPIPIQRQRGHDFCFISMRDKSRALWRFFNNLNDMKAAAYEELVAEGIISLGDQ